jgi:Zn-dependent protease with chaperone function
MHSILIADAMRAALPAASSHAFVAFSAFAQIAAPIAVEAMWQGASIAVALVLYLRISPRIPAAHRFAVWTAGFAVVVALPFLTFLARIAAGAKVASPISGPTVGPWLELDNRWGLMLALLWLVAATFRAAELAFHSLRLRKLWKTATPVEPEESARTLLAAASSSGRPIVLCTTCELDRPGVIGFFAPRILIPEWLYSRLTPGELEQVILHEAEHLHRRDDWTNLLQKLALVLFPLNPALAWMERRLCREREMACDDGVIRRTHAPRAYAVCLTSLAERGLQRRELLRRAHALSLGAFERRPELTRRVHSILGGRQGLHPVVARMLVGVVGCGLLAGSAELARSPQLVAFVAAQKPDAQTAALEPKQIGTAGTTRAAFAPASETVIEPRATGFRALQAKVILPATRGVAAPPAPGSTRRGEELPAGATESALVAPAIGVLREQLVKVVASTSAAAGAQSQEYVVLAAWEQVQTISPRSRDVADYDTGKAAQEQTGAAIGQPASVRLAQITVTRWILVVCPASSAPSLKPGHATSSHSNWLPAPSVDGGWLVFQL